MDIIQQYAKLKKWNIFAAAFSAAEPKTGTNDTKNSYTMDTRQIPDQKKTGIRGWLPVIGLAFSTFIFNTSEFIPIGLLSDIASDFGITESNAGMLITVYAWVVALASLPLMLVFAKSENKRLMLSVTAVFIASQILSGLSRDFYMLMISRIGVACAHSIFWSIVTPYAVRIAPEGKGSAALSVIVCGSSIAMIAGLPIGRTIGLYLGWRATFLVIAASSAVILAILAAVLPKTPSDSSISLRKLPALIKSPVLLNIYLITVIAVTGHFTAYSYIEPFLAHAAGFSETWITVALTIFGFAGLLGSFLFSKKYDDRRIAFISTTLDTVNNIRRRRLAGLQEALEDKGATLQVLSRDITPEEELDNLNIEYATGLALTEECLKRYPKCTALVAVNDSVAYGVLDALAAHGLKVPEDRSVCAFDNLPFSRLSCMDLTSVEHHIADKGRNAFEMFFERISKKSTNNITRVEFSHYLRVGKTTGPCPGSRES